MIDVVLLTSYDIDVVPTCHVFVQAIKIDNKTAYFATDIENDTKYLYIFYIMYKVYFTGCPALGCQKTRANSCPLLSQLRKIFTNISSIEIV